MNTLRSLSLVLLLALFAVPASAQLGGRGFGGVRENAKVLKRYDTNGDGVLDAAERRAALIDFGFDLDQVTQSSDAPVGVRLAPAQVKRYGDQPLYDPAVVRTVFLRFDSPTWEDELAVFKDSDAKVPATVEVDGHVFHDVGVSFRGQTSFRITSAGQKRSMNLDFDFRNKKQRFLGNRRLTLLNAAQDPSFLRTMLYLHVAREYYPAFKANFVRVVINGESWGVYVSQQPADEAFAGSVGAGRSAVWKVPGSPNGRGGLEYWGEDPTPYQRVYELTHKGGKAALADWQALIRLCRVLNQTPPDNLAAALEPLLDVDAALRYLAVDNALMNGDGYYTRASDYSLYLDAKGRFHVVTHDANETFRPPEVFGGWRRRPSQQSAGASASGNELSLDPLSGADQQDKALLYRLLAVPEYRQRYLDYVRDISDRWLDWKRIGPVARRYHDLIADDVHRDVHKLYSNEAFDASLESGAGGSGATGGGFGTATLSLRSFVEQRHAYLATRLGAK